VKIEDVEEEKGGRLNICGLLKVIVHNTGKRKVKGEDLRLKGPQGKIQPPNFIFIKRLMKIHPSYRETA